MIKRLFFILNLKRTVFFCILLSASTISLSNLNAQIINNEAGNNTLGYGYSGDGGLASAAQLHTPNGVSVDTAGNVYITDLKNSVLRQVSTSGIITTIAGTGISGFSGDGGQATAAELNNPTGASFDKFNNYYIADCQNSRIRQVITTTGIINTYAGNGVSGYSGDGGPATAAEFAKPMNIAADHHGYVYIADHDNNVIRQINTSTGIINTIAGNNAFGSGYNGDGGQATDAELNNPSGVAVDTSGNIYIADQGNNVIREVTLSSGIITTVAGDNALGAGFSGDGGLATSAQLNSPYELWVRKTGNIYIADVNNCVVREVIVSTGNISTIAGNHALGCAFAGDGGLATAAQLNLPACAAFNVAGDMFIADGGNQVVRVVNHSTNIITTLAGNNTLGYGYSGDGGVATSAQLHLPNAVAIDKTGNILIADYTNQVIRKINGGIITTIAGNYLLGPGYAGDGGAATAAELNNPSDVAVDASNNMYIADYSNNVIRKVSGGIISTVAGNNAFGAGYSGDGGPATNAELNNPTGVAVDSVGNIYIADYANHVIREVTISNGNINTIAGNFSLGGGFSGDGGPAISAQLAYPMRVKVGHGKILVSEVDSAFVPVIKGHRRVGVDGGNQDIREINAGIITTAAGNHALGTGFSGDGGPATAAELNNPAGLAIDSMGNFYIADYSNQVIREVSGGIITTVVGNHAYGAGFSGNGGPATAAELNNPAGIAITNTEIYIADKENQVVRKVNIVPSGINTMISQGSRMQIYPNPANDRLYIRMTGQENIQGQIEIFDIAGRLQLTYNLQPTASDNSIDVSTLKPGMYLVRVTNLNHRQTAGKFIIEN